MKSTKDQAPKTARAHGWRDVAASVVFHGMELLCVALILDRIPLLGAAFVEQGALSHTPSSRTLFEVCDFVGTQRPLVVLLIVAFLVIDTVIMARLWHAPKPWAARVWFTAIAGVPVLALAAVLAALCVPLGEALAR